MSTLGEIFMDHEGYLIDKWEQYLGIYEAEFSSFITAGKPISLLEIGIQNGGSLQVWRKFLPEGSRIVGIDVNPDCTRLELDENTILHIADGTDQTILDGVLGDTTFDVIIDDGSHRSDHIVSTYRALFARLRGGGKYIIEDLHASYWSEYGGGFRTKDSAVEFLKGLVDGLNCDHFRDTGLTPRRETDHLRDFGRSVSRMTFYDSVAVIDLMNVPRDTSYRQLFSGGEARVMPLSTLFFVGGRPSAETRLVGRTAARHVDQMLIGRISELSAALAEAKSVPPAPPPPAISAEAEAAIGALTAQNAALTAQNAALTAQNDRLRAELADVRASTCWRATAPVRKVAGLLGRG